MRRLLGACLGGCILAGCLTWCARCEEPKAPAEKPGAQPLRPVTIAVVDAATKKPVGEFSYRYRFAIASGGGKRVPGEWTEWTTVNPSEGAVQVEAPLSGTLSVEAKADGYVGVTGPVATAAFNVHDTDQKPQFVVNVHRSVTVRGIVIDKGTRKPIENASVAPTIYTRLRTAPRNDPACAVQSDKQGRFEMPFCDAYLGYGAWHDDYEMLYSKRDPFGDRGSKLDRTKPVEVTIELTAKQRVMVRGTVKSADGKPLAGVKISDETKSHAESNADGSFAIACGRANSRSPYKVEFAAPGYFARTASFDAIPARGLAVVLKPVYPLAWHVVSPEGKPVPRLTFFLGPTRNPPYDGCDQTEVDNPHGEIRLAVGEPVKGSNDYSEFLGDSSEFWVCVRAQGYAVWEEVVTADDLTKPRTIQLKPGATVSGSVVPPATGLKKARAILKPQRAPVEPQRGTPPWANEAASRRLGESEAEVGADAVFRFGHVRPDAYTLDVSGESIAPIQRLVVVPDGGVRLEPLKAEGTGRIVGQAGAKWSSTSGWIHYASWGRYIGETDPHGGPGRFHDIGFSFSTDKGGRFSVDGVPAGLLTVGFTYAPFDVVYEDHRAVQVVEGQATEVRFFDTSGDWDLPLEIVIGDGSERQFVNATRSLSQYSHRKNYLSTRLESEPGQRVSYPAEERVSISGFQDRRTAIRDVSPGKYRLAVYAPSDRDHLYVGRFPAYEADIDVKPKGPPIRVELGAGAIAGQMPPGGVYYDKAKVFVVPEAGGRPIRDKMGYVAASFEVRFVPPGEYSVIVWDEERSRFSRLDGLAVTAETPASARLPRWVAGGTITGRVRLTETRSLPTAVTATDAQGVTVDAPGFHGLVGEQFTIRGLWQGPWTLNLRAGDELLASAKVAVRGTETVQVDLVGK
jgi:hypothetical protein